MAECGINPFTSHGVRLARGQWIIAGLFTIALFVLLPMGWKSMEKFELEPDYRTPYVLSNDYWQYARYAQMASKSFDTIVIGDSVVWGQYVTRNQTLTHYLNETAGRARFANLGLDGAHPAALAGLIEYYCGEIRNKRVILNCNTLWMSSPRHDLQIAEEFRFNHARLTPQFTPNIPCYKEPASTRLGIVVERNLPFNSWTGHVQSSYFGQSDIPTWTLDHPYQSPLSAVTFRLPLSDNTLRHEPISWTERGIKKQEFPFVALEYSFQWRSFQHAVELLQERGNDVFVMAGPLNEHMLDDASVKAYQKTKEGIEAWLKMKKLPYYMPAPLPSEQYADASHPLSEGYKKLARQLYEKLEKMK